MTEGESDAVREDRLRRLAPTRGWALGRALNAWEAGGPVYGLTRAGVWIAAGKVPGDFTRTLDQIEDFLTGADTRQERKQ